jgi:general L-amino acid transport system permease protein
MVTVVLGVVTLVAAVPVVRWALVTATWTGTAEDCRAGAGACWAFVGAKLQFMVFGLYPPDAQWRALLATVLLMSLVVMSALPRFWSRWLIAGWAMGIAAALWLMGGGLGLPSVPTRMWGGLPVTLALTAIGLALGFPIGVLMAFGRQSRRPLLRAASATMVEGIRGIPLIAVLYVAALVFPLALPSGLQVDKLILAQVAVALFAAAYLGEAVRSGLQMIPKRQREAAFALGFTWWRSMRLVILPQALRVVLPSLVSIAVGFFQDTSLVVVIGLFDLLNTTRLAAQDPDWLGFHTEAYVFAALLYFAGSSSITRYGRWLEGRLRVRGASAIGS